MPVRKKRTGKRNARGRGTRKPARKKATRKKAPATSVRKNPTSSHHAQSFAVMTNPFSKATQRPKIPDGSTVASLSRRIQRVSEIKNKQGEDIMDLVMCPALGLACVIKNVDGENATLLYKHYPFINQGVESSFDGAQIVNDHAIAKWRLVSQGISFQLANTDEENDGWWEACRFNPTIDPAHFDLARADGTQSGTFAGNTVLLTPDSNYFSSGTGADGPAFTLKGNMVEQPGYTTGLLKDIHKHQFKLLNNNHNIEWQDRNQELSISGVISSTDNVNSVVNLQDADKFLQLYNELYCNSYDCIFIRFHCRVNNGSTSNGSKLIMNAIQNVEMVYSPQSDLATYHEINKAHAKVKAYLDKMNDSQNVVMRNAR
ncbi:hypothetical protein [Protobacilladnavirus tenuis]|uniref:Capsid protein n=1 Tax=Protobacilladnavirus tenuis TaxID=3052706 RepID=E3WH28_9VIRU|nr:hypothetical protein [Protobacilladnavirus tenuis]BAJ40166.1 hypothetical protein [Protobacilladnavirus tenuis]